jgi:hypothetical protein
MYSSESALVMMSTKFPVYLVWKLVCQLCIMVLSLPDCFLPMLPSFQPITIYLTLRKSIQVKGLVKNAMKFVSAMVAFADFRMAVRQPRIF